MHVYFHVPVSITSLILVLNRAVKFLRFEFFFLRFFRRSQVACSPPLQSRLSCFGSHLLLVSPPTTRLLRMRASQRSTLSSAKKIETRSPLSSRFFFLFGFWTCFSGQLDKDLRCIMGFFVQQSGRSAREPFSRLVQVSAL